ncbi:MAG: ribose-phosphate diphosphokinase [Nanobdellota archaeon]
MKDVVLLADPKTPAWGFAEKIQDYIHKTKEELVPLYEINICFFNNKELNISVPENIRKKHIYYIHDSSKDPQQWWVELLLIKDLLLSASVESTTFVLPNMLYSRQDRKHMSRVPISSRALGNSIAPGLKRIITVDLHSPQIQNAYPANVPLDNLHSFPDVVRYLEEKHMRDIDDLVIVAPDVGGANRARSFLKKLEALNQTSFRKRNYSLAIIDKYRQKAGEISDMQLVGEVAGKDALIIDDIIDTGSTLCKSADLLREKGAKKVMCYATHGIFSKGHEELNKKFDLVITSNTHYQESNSVEVIDLAPLFAEAIYRAQKGLSVSKLFD